MPISGKFYTSKELQELLNVKKQRISNLARDRDWNGPLPGVYWAEEVEPYLEYYRNIDPLTLPVKSFDFPAGATWQEREAAYDEIRKAQEAEINDDDFTSS